MRIKRPNCTTMILPRWLVCCGLTVALLACGEDGPASGQDAQASADVASTDDTGNDGAQADGSACKDNADCTYLDSNTGCAAGRCIQSQCKTIFASEGKQCQIAGQLVTECEDSQCSSFGACKVVPLADGSECGDGKCGDACSAGKCAIAKPQDDGNPCTAEYCKNGVFAVQQLTDPSVTCSDGDPCTHGDSCVDGKCAGKKQPCDDGVKCTIDWCDPDKGCQLLPADGLCSDANPCVTVGCDANKGCQQTGYKKAIACDDGNPCTAGDNCNSVGECVGTTNACDCKTDTDCKTTNVCKPLLCQGGKCYIDSKTAAVCDPAKDPLCATNACDPKTGKCALAAVKQGQACDDGDPCTSKSACAAGDCKGASDVVCDDGNACTKDLCTNGTGCTFTPSTQGCDDGDVCTVGDTCSAVGGCKGLAIKCDDGDPCTADQCNVKTGACGHEKKANCAGCISAADCKDDNACTQDVCLQDGKCGHLALPNCTKKCTSSAECDDGDVCTTDVCDAGFATCTYATVANCVAVQCKSPADCNDQNACTSDLCAQSKCVHVPVGCDDKNPCTNDSCSTTTGTCEHTGVDGCVAVPCQFVADCQDANACTTDSCSGGYCSFTFIPGCSP